MKKLLITLIKCIIIVLPVNAEAQESKINIDSADQQTKSIETKSPQDVTREFGTGRVEYFQLAKNGVPTILSGDINIGITAVDPIEKSYQFFEVHKDLFRIVDPHKELLHVTSITDGGKIVAAVFRQIHNGIKVENSQYVIHFNQDGTLSSANGSLFPEARQVNTSPTISKERAKELAVIEANNKRINLKCIGLTEPVIRWCGNNYCLCWSIELTNVSAAFSWQYYIDAKSGEVIDKECLMLMDPGIPRRKLER